jgi:hypothetical protein
MGSCSEKLSVHGVLAVQNPEVFAPSRLNLSCLGVSAVHGRCVLLCLVVVILCLPWLNVTAQSTDPDVFIEAYVSLPEPFAGQQIEYQVRFFDAIGVNNPLYEAPDFEGFWRVEPDRITRTVEVRGSRQYSVTDIHTTLYANAPGDVPIASARVIIPETVFAPGQILETPTLMVRSRPLPAGAPPDFSGAVGQLTLEASLNARQIRVGEPITLRLLLTGTVNVLVLPPPDITALQGWRAYVQSRTATFDTASPGLIGQQEIQIVLFPAQEGSFALPALVFPYFDPLANAYNVLSTGEIPLEVLPAPEGSTQTVPQAIVVPALYPVNLNVVSLDLTHHWLLWVIGPLVLLIAWLWRSRDFIQARLFAKEAAQSPLHQARHSIRLALRSGQPYAAFEDALYIYLRHKTQSAESLSLTELCERIAATELNEKVAHRLMGMVENLSASQFAPLSTPTQPDLRQQAQQLDALLLELEAALQ